MWLDDPLPMLRETVARAAATIPHYREDPAYTAPLRDLADLARLPLVRPEAFAAAPERFAVPGVWPELVTYSSSTTGAIGRERWHLQRELDAYAAALGEVAPGALAGEGATLVIHPYDQGAMQRASGDRRAVYVPFLVPWHYELILRLLREGWRTPAGTLRFDHVDAFSPALRIYSEWLRGQGVAPGSLGIRGLTGYGSLQPGPWRRRLTREWGAEYQDIYGLSEVKHSEATSCPACGAYHFVRPIVAEVIDPVSEAPVREGCGVLVLSELYPFAEAQVLLRYWTGDLVEIAGPCLFADLGFWFRGRAASCAAVEGEAGRAYVGPVQVAEILAEAPDVALGGYPWASWAQDVGAPRFIVRQEGARVIVEVELRYAPELFPGRAAEVAAAARARIGAEVRGLAAAMEGGAAVEVRARGPGALEAVMKV